jgi:hypothetical protein
VLAGGAAASAGSAPVLSAQSDRLVACIVNAVLGGCAQTSVVARDADALATAMEAAEHEWVVAVSGPDIL